MPNSPTKPKTISIKIKPTGKTDSKKVPVVKINDKIYTTIFHISDIHIRPDERLEEFESVFQNLYKFLDSQTTTNALLVITGDIYYSKNVFKPNSNYLLAKFFKETSKRIEVILITGNHDMNEQNLEQIDALTPLLAFSPVHYLRDTGLYQFGNFVFSVSSLTDAKFIKYSDIDKSLFSDDTVFIKLYHGMLKGAIGDNGMELKVSCTSKTSRNKKPSDFKGYDAVLLGDIHKYQFLDKRQRIAYCGSLIQQNHGESLDFHGVLIWKFNGKKISTQFVEIENRYGFITFDVVDNELINKLDKYPEFIYARFKLSKSTDLVVDTIEQMLIKNGSKIVNKNVKYTDTVLLDDIVVDADETTFDDVTVIKNLLKDEKFDDTYIDEMVKYHETVKSKILVESDHLSSVWKPDNIEFRNFFLYGGDHTNTIEFKKGVMSICSPNNTGKTSTLKTILFGLFGELYNDFGSTLSYTNSLDNKKYAYTDVNFSIGQRVFNVKREYEKIVNVKKGKYAAFKHTFKENTANKTGIHKVDTNKKITNFIGSKDMFVTLNVCSTKINSNFANFNKKDLNKFLQQIFKLDVFEKYEKVALADKKLYNDKMKMIEGSLHILRSQMINPDDFKKQLADMAKSITKCEKQRTKYSTKLTSLKNKRLELEQRNSKLCKLIDNDCFENDFDDIETKYKLDCKKFKNSKPANVTELNTKLEKLFNTIIPVNDDVQDDYDECMENLEELKWTDKMKMKYSANKIDSTYTDLKLQKMSLERDIKINKDKLSNATVKKLEKQKAKLIAKLGGKDKLKQLDNINASDLNSKISELHSQKSIVGAGTEEELIEVQTELTKLEKIVKIVDEDFDMEQARNELSDMRSELAVINDKIGSDNDGDVTSDPDVIDAINTAISELGTDTCTEMVSVDNDGKIVVTFSKKPIKSTSKSVSSSRSTNIDRVRDVTSWIDNAEHIAKRNSLLSDVKKIETTLRIIELKSKCSDISIDIANMKKNSVIDSDIEQIRGQIEGLAFVTELKDIEMQLNEYVESEKKLNSDETQFSKVNKELDIIDTEKMIYELLNEKTKLEKDLVKIEKNNKTNKLISDVKTEISTNQQIIDFIELEKLYNKFVQSKDTLEEINKIENEMNDLDCEIIKNNNDMETLVSTIGTLTSSIDELKSKEDANTKCIEKINTLCTEHDALKKLYGKVAHYKDLVKYNGVPNALLIKKKKDICEFVNNFISEFTNIKVNIIDDSVCVKKDGYSFHIGNVGGFESWLIGVAFKTALNRFSYFSKSAIMLIDEEVDCIDVENFDTKLPEIMNKLKKFYYTILLISHRDVTKLKDWDIVINNNGTYSRIETVK